MNNRETRTIILDGGTGTMLQARGMKPGEDSTAFAYNNPDVVEDVARQYIEAGSQAVYTPTFNLTRDKVAGLGETVESLCLKLTEPARRLRDEYAAKGRSLLVIFDMGPQGELVEPLTVHLHGAVICVAGRRVFSAGRKQRQTEHEGKKKCD